MASIDNCNTACIYAKHRGTQFYKRTTTKCKTQGSEASKSDLTWKLSPWRLAFMISQGTLQVSKEGKQATVLPSYLIYKPQWSAPRRDKAKGSLVACRAWQ